MKLKQVYITPSDYGLQGPKLLVDIWYQIKKDRVHVDSAMFESPDFAVLNDYINLNQLECRLNTDYRLHGAL